MIRSVHVDDAAVAKSLVPHWEQARVWSGRTDWTFHPQLTVVVGPNGSGKSSLLRLLGELLHAEQGGYSKLTPQSVQGGRDTDRASVPWHRLKLEHDGRGIRCYHADHVTGLVGGMAGFDYDFMDEAMLGIRANRASSGQAVLMRLNTTLNALALGEVLPPILEEKGWVRELLDKPAYAAQRAHLQGSLPVGPPTFILDEPDRNMDAEHQIGLWRLIDSVTRAGKAQVILATHNMWILHKVDPSCVLEAKPDYFAQLQRAF